MLNTVNVPIKNERHIKPRANHVREPDPFWSEQNQARIAESLRQLQEGKVVIKTTKELEAMENE